MKGFLKLSKRVLIAVNMHVPTVVVFFGDINEIPEFTSIISSNLPLFYHTTIDLLPLSKSTSYLRGSRNCTVFFADSCFKHTTPEQFLSQPAGTCSTGHEWLVKYVERAYNDEPELKEFFPAEDMVQELYFYLERILSKFDNQCKIESFVANRLRFYFAEIVKRQIEKRRQEIIVLLGNTK